MATGINRNRIYVKGGNEFWVRELHPTASNTFVSLGLVEKVDFKGDPDIVLAHDAQGLLQQAASGGETIEMDITILQTHKDEIDYVRTLDGKTLDAYYPQPIGDDGVYQEWRFPVLKIPFGLGTLGFGKSSRRVITLKAYALAPKAAFTATPTAFNVTKNVPYIVTANSSLHGAPTDTASSLATACV